jgi:hypothetical protein
MTHITITTRNGENLYGLLVAKELDLRRKKKGTLHKSGKTPKNIQKWVHESESYPGWIRFQRCLGESVVAIVQSKKGPSVEWQLLTSFVGFLERHFRAQIGNISITFRESDDAA